MANFVINSSVTTPQVLTDLETGFITRNGELIVGGDDAISITGSASVTIDGSAFVTDFDTSPFDSYEIVDHDGQQLDVYIGPNGVLNSNGTLITSFVMNAFNLQNAGTLITKGIAVNVNDGIASDPQISVNNSGTIQSGGTAIYLDSQTRLNILTNSGTISATGVAILSNPGLSDGGTRLVNTGTITGENSGFVGGAGVDRIYNSGVLSGATLGDGNDLYEGGGGRLLKGVGGGEGNDTLLGGDFRDFLIGDSGDDLVVGRGGDDKLWGGLGGLDTILGGDGNDEVLGSTDADLINGNAGDDTIDGRSGNDTIVGQDGADQMAGGTGDDILLGGQGDDSMDGGIMDDTLNGNAGDDTLLGSFGNDLLVGQDGADVLEGGDDSDTLDGGNGDDILEGGDGNDILRGRSGEDELAGGLGRDFLTGGQDADTFVFRALTESMVGANRDQILDFEQGVDLITVAGLSPGVFEFKGTAAFAPSGNPELRLIETAAGSTIVQIDENGDGTADAEIRVANVTGLTAEDFVL